jgi:hypothetical protein
MDIDGDPLFGYFLGMAETSDVSLTVTVAVHGALIGGTLIGSVAYIDGLAELLPAAIADRQMRQQWGEQLRSAATTGRGVVDQGAIHVAYAHLRDAVLVTTDGHPMAYPFWRVRLAAIDGWAFGVLATHE